MSWLRKLTSTGVNCARIRIIGGVPHGCNFSNVSISTPRGCGLLDAGDSELLLKNPRVVISTRYYGKGSGASLSSQFVTKPMIVLKNNDSGLVQRLVEFENQRVEYLLEFLETVDSRMFESREIEVTLKLLTNLLENERNRGTKNVMSSVGMQKFCRTLKKNLSQLDENVLLQNLRLFSLLEVPGSNIIFQSMMQLLLKQVSTMGVPQLVYLHKLLCKLKEGSNTPLADALKQTLPIVFESHVLLRLDNSATAVELCDFLNFAVENKCSDEVVKKIIQNLMEKQQYLSEQDAFRIVLWLVERRTNFQGIEDLLKSLFEILTKQIEVLDISQLRLLLVRCSGECLHGRKAFYNPEFLDAALNRILQTGDELIVLNALKSLWAMKHINVELLETSAELLIANPALILNDDGLFYSTLKTYADLNYKPEKWDILKSIFLNHPATTKNPTKRDLPLIYNFLILDEAPTNLLESFPSVEHLQESKRDYLELALIFNAIKQLFPNCNVPATPASALQAWSEQMREKSKKFTYPLKDALISGLGGESYVITGLVHDGLHIDHCIVLRHGGYPVFQTDPSPEGLDDIQRPENSFLILIKIVRPNAYLWNTDRLRGSYALERKVLETYAHCIYINASEWQELSDSRKVPYLMEKIREFTGSAPS